MCEITKDYQAVHALKRVDIQVSKGEIVGLVGANGAGKSTLVKILGGQLKNYSGTIAVNNVPVKLSSPTVSQKCRIGVLPQEPQFAWNLSIRDNLLLFGGERPPFGRLFEELGTTSEPKQRWFSTALGYRQMPRRARSRAVSFNFSRSRAWHCAIPLFWCWTNPQRLSLNQSHNNFSPSCA